MNREKSVRLRGRQIVLRFCSGCESLNYIIKYCPCCGTEKQHIERLDYSKGGNVSLVCIAVQCIQCKQINELHFVKRKIGDNKDRREKNQTKSEVKFISANPPIRNKQINIGKGSKRNIKSFVHKLRYCSLHKTLPKLIRHTIPQARKTKTGISDSVDCGAHAPRSYASTERRECAQQSERV